nr:MAG TPA: hypothetical protein [Caudoviricetes sp.]
MYIMQGHRPIVVYNCKAAYSHEPQRLLLSFLKNQ